MLLERGWPFFKNDDRGDEMRIQELTQYLETYLRAGEFHDYAPNGLQVEGSREVEHIVLGVSA